MAHTNDTGATTGPATSRSTITLSPAFQQQALALGYHLDPAQSAGFGGLTEAQWTDVAYHLNPNLPLPPGVQVENGHVVSTPPNFLLSHPWLFPLIGIGAGVGLTVAGVGGAGAAATDAGAGAADAGAEGGFDAAGNFIGGSTVTDATGTSALGDFGASASGPSILGTVGKFGTALSSIAGGLQQGRQQQTVDQQNQDRNQISAAQVNLGAPSARMGSAVKGDILSNAKDFSYGAPTMVGNIPVPSSSGGLRPSIFSPQTKALGSLVSSQSLANETADGGNPVKLTPIPQASTGANILGTVGNVAQLVGLLKGFQ